MTPTRLVLGLAPILAHQGGWDELLLVAVPIFLFAGLLWLANHRAEAQVREREAGTLTDSDGSGEAPEDDGTQAQT